MKRIRTLLRITVMFLSLFASGVEAQNRQGKNSDLFLLNGIVTDTYGEPLIGATVREDKTFKGTVTNDDGKFSIQVRKGQTLLFDYVGMKQHKLLVNSTKFIRVMS